MSHKINHTAIFVPVSISKVCQIDLQATIDWNLASICNQMHRNQWRRKKPHQMRWKSNEWCIVIMVIKTRKRSDEKQETGQGRFKPDNNHNNNNNKKSSSISELHLVNSFAQCCQILTKSSTIFVFFPKFKLIRWYSEHYWNGISALGGCTRTAGHPNI